MKIVLKMMEQDTAESSVEKLDQESLSTVAGLARAIREKEAYIEDLEKNLKDEKKNALKNDRRGAACNAHRTRPVINDLGRW